MIHATHNDFASISSRTFKASPTHRDTYATHGSSGRSHHAPIGFSPVSFAEPEISSLWDAGLLDRLSLPLTRYHE
jgi:hypothetical protein